MKGEEERGMSREESSSSITTAVEGETHGGKRLQGAVNVSERGK